MAPPPPRPAASRQGGPASAGTPSSSGLRPKDAEKQGPATFFLGRYRVVDEIGVGGMASVHLARMDGPGGFQKWVAIKRIHPHLVEDDQFVDMFLDEARIAAGINHANVAQVFDLGKDDNTYWIAMEYLHGEPLREVMRRSEERGQRISPVLAARICADAAEGLHAAHELRGKNGQLLGLVHRDVTPHNLFLTYDGYTKVVDFGIAKVADRLSSTRAGTLKGKLAYMSPEQVRGAEVDRTTDIFALGVVLWEVTTNQRLFRMDTDLDTLEKVQACVVPPPSTIVPGYPPELEACVLKALSKRKQDRFQTAREFSRALQGFLVRSGQFVGPEEVAQFIRNVFGDRIQKREAHLAWAAEVTSNVSLEQLRAGKPGGAGDEARGAAAPPVPSTPSSTPASTPAGSAPSSGERPRAQGYEPPAPARPAPAPAPAPPPQRPAVPQAMASQSLIDDDEDVPTTVALREHLEPLAALSNEKAPPLRPGAGAPPPGAFAPGPAGPAPAAPRHPPATQAMPAMAPSPASYVANASYAANVARPAPTFGPSPGYAASGAPGYGQPQAFPPQGAPKPPGFGGGFDERTAAIPTPEEGFGATVALPMAEAAHALAGPTFGAHHSPPGAMPPGANGHGFGGGPAPTFGQPPANPALTPAGFVGGVPMNLPIAPMPGAPQSQIETALSLPRPDPSALWLAQQERQRSERRNTGVLIAVIALAALCVLGIAAIVFFKIRARSQPSGVDVPAVTATAAGAAPKPTATASPKK